MSNFPLSAAIVVGKNSQFELSSVLQKMKLLVGVYLALSAERAATLRISAKHPSKFNSTLVQLLSVIVQTPLHCPLMHCPIKQAAGRSVLLKPSNLH